jgi:phage tail P2-like protein
MADFSHGDFTSQDFFVNIDLGTPPGLTVGSPAIPILTIGVKSILQSLTLAVGSPVLGVPIAGAKNNLQSQSLAVGSPVIGAATLVATGGAQSLTVGSPTFGVVTLTVKYNFQTLGLTVGSPALPVPTIAAISNLQTSGLTVGSPVFGATTLRKNLQAQNLTVGSPVIDAMTIDVSQKNFQPPGVTVGSPLFGAPTIAGNHYLQALYLTAGVPVLSAPTMNAALASLQALGLTGGSPTIGAPTVGVINNLQAQGLSVASPALDAPTLGVIRNLQAQALTVGSPVLDVAPVGVTINLQAPGVTVGSPAIGAASINVGHDLQPQDLTVGSPIINAASINAEVIKLRAQGFAVDVPVFGMPEGSTRDLFAVGMSAGRPVIDVPLLQQADPITPGILATAGEDLLYRQAAGLEKALATVDGYRLIATYAEIIRDQWDPYAIRYMNLPYLAWAMGVNLWEEDWDETFRRWWVANQWELKSQRGSLLGIKRFVDAVGGKVVKAIVPPSKFFPTKSYTAEDRAAYVARFPQLRLYPFVGRVQLPYLCYPAKFLIGVPPNTTKKFTKNGNFTGPLRKFYPTAQDAGGNYTRTATLWDRGIETPLTFRTVTDLNAKYGVTTYDEVMLPARLNNHYYMGEADKWPLPNKHPTRQNKYGIFLGADDGTLARMIRIPRDGRLTLSQAKAIYQTIVPGGKLIDLYPDYVATVHPTSKRRLFGGKSPVKQFLYEKYLPPTISWEYLYERWYVLDLNRAPDYRKGWTYIGVARLGIKRYSAEIKIEMFGVWHPWFFRSGGFVRGHTRAPDLRAIEKLRRACTASMAIRDTVGIDTKVKRMISTNDSLPIDGTYTVGEFINA